jgi:hypothetical protein
MIQSSLWLNWMSISRERVHHWEETVKSRWGIVLFVEWMKNESKIREASRHLPWPGKQSISKQSVHRVDGFISIISGNTWNLSMHTLSWLWAYHRGSKLWQTSTGEMNVETHSLSPENSKHLKTVCYAK